MKKSYTSVITCFLIIGAYLVVQSGTSESKPLEKATFAAGCFWGVEKIFRSYKGVKDTAVGYAGGGAENPSYEAVTTGLTGHAEAVLVEFDPDIITYKELLKIFWSYHDPTTPDRQGPDIGSQYRSVIFYHSDDQKALAEKSVKILNDAGVYAAPIVTQVVPEGVFYKAEEYHQRYLEKNPNGYCSHKFLGAQIEEALKVL